jgi:hypothetical protein
LVGLLISLLVFGKSEPEKSVSSSDEVHGVGATAPETRRQLDEDREREKVVGRIGLRSSLETITSSLGPGQKRELAIQLAFANSDSSMTECLDLYRNLEDQGEKRSANLGIAFRLAREGDLSLIYDLLDQSPELTTKEVSIFANGLGLMIDPQSVNRFRGMDDYIAREEVVAVPLGDIFETMKQLMEYEPQGRDRDHRLRGLLEHAHRDRPFEAFELFQSDLIDRTGDYGDLLKNTVGWMFGENPSRALETLEAGNFSMIGPREFEFGLKSWMAMDRAEASAWLKEEGSKLPKNFGEAALGALARNFAENGDVEEAKAMVGEIVDPVIKKEINDAIWTGELRSVKLQAQTDPLKTLDSLVSGASPHEEYWIKEGFKTWFSSSPDSANEWFSKNERTLTPSQTQHVARAYAEVALSEGNVDLARQWSEQVVDAEFKEKLVNQIEAATANSSE